ncbi:chorismate-binding protein [Sphingomonas sp. ASV193]|uniref:chorismate-binding protein n=1 Tax=Sphingomonas sp. ASV193 TaxID=3144405 RepID=UPI0032E8FBCB
MKIAGEGETALLARRLAERFDSVELADRLGAAFLFRRTGGAALILVDAALRLEAKGGEAVLTALSDGGEALLAPLAARLAANLVAREPRRLALRYDRCDDPDEAVRAAAPSALDPLRALVSAIRPADRDERFALVAMGLVGFDHVDMVEALPPAAPGDFPDLVFVVPETLVVVEPGGASRVLSLAAGDSDEARARRLYHLATERLVKTVARCELPAPPREEAPPPRSEAVPDLDDAAFAGVVARLKEHVAAGDIFQAVPSRAFRAPCDDPAAAFRRLVAADPSAYQYRFDTGHGTLFGASPETAVEIRREGEARKVIVRPIAGTRPRGATGDEDDRLEADLRLDQKENAEHMMLVDLARNDVARVAIPGTRRVTRLLDTLRFRRVMHLESTVEGELPGDADAIDVIRTCLNVGTLSGAPKLSAIDLIRRVEASPRGPYGGAIGYLTGDGAMDTAVVIRSALVRGGVAEVRAGAGVVADSVPLAEAAETRAKASAVLAAIGAVA